MTVQKFETNIMVFWRTSFVLYSNTKSLHLILVYIQIYEIFIGIHVFDMMYILRFYLLIYLNYSK